MGNGSLGIAEVFAECLELACLIEIVERVGCGLNGVMCLRWSIGGSALEGPA
jgi:hypothetical protein